jgi:hypothetical protein
VTAIFCNETATTEKSDEADDNSEAGQAALVPDVSVRSSTKSTKKND